jgi:6-pyruvoyltetrahydropterin/6-carboxytetrahydropterin synthase
MRVRVTKEFRFEMAHALSGHDGPCKNIHGHSYVLQVTLKGTPLEDNEDPKSGMVMDFSDLKKIVRQEITDVFDHALVLHRKTSQTIQQSLSQQKLVLIDFQPTC